MAEERQILLEIEVDKKGAQKQLEENAELLELNKAELSNLNKAYKDGEIDVADYAKAKLQLTQKNKELGSENRKLIKTLDTEDNSLNALRANLSKLVSERNNVNQQTTEGAKRFKQLQSQILDTTNAIKGQEEAGGDFRRSVGNYQTALTNNIPILNQFKGQLEGIRGALVAQKAVLQGTTKSLGLFRTALLATGIGAIVVVLGTLITALTTTQEGIDTVTKFTRPLQQIFQRLIGVVQDLGLALLNPVKAFNDIKDAITSFVSDPVGSIKSAAEGVKNFAKEAIDAGTRIDQLTKAIELQEIALVKLEGTNQRIFEQQKEIAENQENDIQARIAAAREALRVQTELEQARIDLLNERIKLKKLENEANDTDRNDLLEIAELEKQRDAASAQAAGKRTSVNNLLNTLLKERNKLLETESELLRNQQLRDEATERIINSSLETRKAQDLETENFIENVKKRKIASVDLTKNLEEQAKIKGEIAELEIQQRENVLMAGANVAGALSSLFEQSTAAYKIFASTEAAISTFLAINKTLSAFAGVPIPGYAIAQAVAIGIQGFANVAKINGLGSGGGGASASGGSASTAQPRVTRTALDGSFDRNQLTSGANNAQADRDNVSNSIANMPQQVVRVTDINKKQNQTVQVQVTGSL